jgi:hypothetical protein
MPFYKLKSMHVQVNVMGSDASAPFCPFPAPVLDMV